MQSNPYFESSSPFKDQQGAQIGARERSKSKKRPRLDFTGIENKIPQNILNKRKFSEPFEAQKMSSSNFEESQCFAKSV